MEQLKRWRVERAARQSLRILGPDPGAWTLPRRASRPQGEPRRGFHFWPIPLPISPVHPEWDDPTGGRLKKGLYNSIVFHALVVPAILLLGNLSIDFHTNHRQTIDRSIAVVFVPPPGGKKAGPKSTAPPTPPVVKPPVEKPLDKPVKPGPKAITEKPTPRPVERNQAESIPKPVPDEALIHQRGKETTEPAEGDGATDPVATPGPLVAGTGPVAGSDTGLGIDGDGGNFPYNYYLVRVREQISQAWEIPQGMVARGRRIEAVARFKIMRDGTIAEAIVEVPSGQAIYDQSALRAISMVRKFAPLPEGFGGRFLVVHFQFGYVGR